jgi:RimJ/RimL family protein N-acetyltransferase
MFIYEEKYVGSPIPVMASTLLLDFFLPVFKLQQVFAKVLASNERAMKYK